MLYKKYKALAEQTPDVHFVGRLATYKYYNMDQVTAQALTLFNKLKVEKVSYRPKKSVSFQMAAPQETLNSALSEPRSSTGPEDAEAA